MSARAPFGVATEHDFPLSHLNIRNPLQRFCQYPTQKAWGEEVAAERNSRVDHWGGEMKAVDLLVGV